MTQQNLDALIEAIAQKDRGAFEQFYRNMERPLFRFVQIKLNDPFRSADIVHEVFLEVWRNAGAFRKKSSVRTWVFSIAYRKVVDIFRREGRLSYQDDLPEQVDESPDAASALIAAQSAEAVRDCLARLKPEHRLAVELAFYEDMSHRDIAAVTGVPEGTVKSRVFHAKQLLMRCLSTRLKTGKQ